MLQFQQLYFFVNAPGVSGKAAVCAHYAVAGDDDGNFVVPHCAANGLRGHIGKAVPCGKLPRNIAIGNGLAVGNFQKNFPYALAECGACGVQRRQKVRLMACKVNIQPTLCLGKGGRVLLDMLCGQRAGKIFLPIEPKSPKAGSVRGKQYSAQGRIVMLSEYYGVYLLNLPDYRPMKL